MKAAVLHQLGQTPVYEDFPDPVPTDNAQVVLTMKAAAIKNLDRGRAAGAHYSAHAKLPAVVGTDGVGVMPDGTRAFALSLDGGMLAQKALVDKTRIVPLPAAIDDATAAALPNAVFGAALALKFRAGMTPGKTVLVNGATGVTGKIAIQLAKHYGATTVIATGRNPVSLASLKTLGADETLSLAQEENAFTGALREIHRTTPIDIVIDYTWGGPMEWILNTFKGDGLQDTARTIRVVSVGSMAGEKISLSSGILRSSAIELMGSGFGSLSREAFQQLNTDILPEMMQLAADGKLHIGVEIVPLSDIEKAWQQPVNPGSRLVVRI